MNPLPDAALASYRALVARVDELCGQVVSAYAAAIVCRPGCAGCCRLSGVLPVEAANLVVAWRSLPNGEYAALEAGQTADGGDDQCPLLDGDLCRLYSARPLICRTHGLPLLIADDHGRRVDRCPLNFTAVDSLPGSAIIDLERLNTALVAVNHQFIARCDPAGRFPERVALRELAAFGRLLAASTESPDHLKE